MADHEPCEPEATMFEDLKRKLDELIQLDREHIAEASDLRHEVRVIHERIRGGAFPILGRPGPIPRSPKRLQKGKP